MGIKPTRKKEKFKTIFVSIDKRHIGQKICKNPDFSKHSLAIGIYILIKLYCLKNEAKNEKIKKSNHDQKMRHFLSYNLIL